MVRRTLVVVTRTGLGGGGGGVRPAGLRAGATDGSTGSAKVTVVCSEVVVANSVVVVVLPTPVRRARRGARSWLPKANVAAATISTATVPIAAGTFHSCSRPETLDANDVDDDDRTGG